MMKDDELLTILRCQRANTIKSDDDFEALNRSLLDSYNQELYGNEVDGRSQVVASDHYDTVESDMPSFARVFLGANKVLSFKPYGEDDKEEARQKTEYADYLIRQQPESFKTLYDWMKEAGLAKVSVIKYYPEEKKRVRYITYKGIDIDELTVFLGDLESGKGVDKVEVVSKVVLGDDRYDVQVRVTVTEKKIRIVNVPIEDFGITRNVSDVQDATLAFDLCTKRKGELIAEGYSQDVVKNLHVKDLSNEEMDRRRQEDQGGYDSSKSNHWTNEEVEIRYEYSLVDCDGDGIPERMLIVSCGNTILEKVPHEMAPYAILCQVPMPHVLIGKSRGEQAAKIQKAKTAVERGIMDNIYAHSRPRLFVDDSAGSIDGGKIDFDDLLNQAIGDVVRVDGTPGDAVLPLVEPYIGGEALQIVQYLEAKKSSSLGTQLSNQGLDSDKFYKETATRFEGVDESNKAKIELVCRCYAEIGFRHLYEGVIWTARHFQDDATEIMVLGKPLQVDPRQWRHEHYCQSKVGLGAGDSEDSIQNLAVTLQTQLQLIAIESPLADWKKVYNTLDDLSRAMGKADTSAYYNDPEIPEQQLMFMVQKLMADNQAMMAQMQQSNPLAEAEQLRAQAKLIEAKAKQDTEAAKLAQDQEQFMLKLQQDQSKFMADIAKQLTELELKYQQNVPGSAV